MGRDGGGGVPSSHAERVEVGRWVGSGGETHVGQDAKQHEGVDRKQGAVVGGGDTAEEEQGNDGGEGRDEGEERERRRHEKRRIDASANPMRANAEHSTTR